MVTELVMNVVNLDKINYRDGKRGDRRVGGNSVLNQ